MIIFDGICRVIEIETETPIRIEDVYSAWKRWVLSGDNMKYRQAFQTLNLDEQGYTLINDWVVNGISKRDILGRFIL
jgi:hypothetical protein